MRKINLLDSYCVTGGLALFLKQLVKRHEEGWGIDGVGMGEMHISLSTFTVSWLKTYDNSLAEDYPTLLPTWNNSIYQTTHLYSR